MSQAATAHNSAMELNAGARQILGLIDHAILQPTVTIESFDREIDSIAELPLASVCVRPFLVARAVEKLEGKVPVGVVVGFPHGCELTQIKAQEADLALDQGALDVDMVVNVSQVLSGDWTSVVGEIDLLNRLVHSKGGFLKVIFENAYLPDHDKIELCQICSKLGVEFVKTSTGFAYLRNEDGSFRTSGATAADVRLMREHTEPHIGVKASGGIRTLPDFTRMVESGANRIGTAATLAILEEYHASLLV